MKKKQNEDAPTASPQIEDSGVTLGRILLKATLLALVFAIGMLFITAIIVCLFAYNQYAQFTEAIHSSPSEFYTQVRNSYYTAPVADSGKKNILILGLDSLETRPGNPALSDTMMLVSLDVHTGKVHTLSLPRDIWSDEFQTKINALYFYGLERYPERPEQFSEEVISKITGIPIHHTILISMDSLEEIIDSVGGIEIDVPNSFTDSQFPRTDIDVTKVSDPSILYQTISFEKGLQSMSGEQALQFIRSRNSTHELESTDLARSKRQQLVITALAEKVLSKEILLNPDKVAKLYNVYGENFGTQFPHSEAMSTVFMILKQNAELELINTQLPVYPDDPNGVIEHPPISEYNNQWVYKITDNEKFAATLQNLLGIEK
ncbi:MAG: LCP family protein [Microgenomates group bacterium]